MASEIKRFSRRRWLLSAAAAAAGTLARGNFSAALAASDCRLTIPLNDDWRFVRRDIAGAHEPDFNDSSWQRVSLPHTYNGIDGEKHGHYYRGPTWYRLYLPRVHGLRNGSQKNYFLYFEGAATVATVYVNGKWIGEHRGNFAGFCFDATREWNPASANILAVRVDNAWNKNIPPLAGDFNIFGGLYRTAHLLILNPVSISPLDYGSPGSYILQEEISRQTARLKLTAMLRNATNRPANVSLDWYAMDHAHRVVATAHHAGPIGAQQQVEAGSIMKINHPHLWHGRIDPYLYTMVIELRQGRKLIDRLTQPLGLRYFHIDPDKGFYLNGESYPLHGVCTHDDRPKIGRAATKADYLQDCAMIADLGARSVRMAHYQHDQTTYDAFDRVGVVVWTEDGPGACPSNGRDWDGSEMPRVRGGGSSRL